MTKRRPMETERNCLKGWVEIARQEHQARCQHKSEEECLEYLDVAIELYLAMEADGYGE